MVAQMNRPTCLHWICHAKARGLATACAITWRLCDPHRLTTRHTDAAS